MRGFKKCGISVSVDGSEDDQINIKGFEVGDSDPFASSEDTGNNSTSENDTSSDSDGHCDYDV